jgi:hypothetical protein
MVFMRVGYTGRRTLGKAALLDRHTRSRQTGARQVVRAVEEIAVTVEDWDGDAYPSGVARRMPEQVRHDGETF